MVLLQDAGIKRKEALGVLETAIEGMHVVGELN
jgi:hypothetical protein